jgi:hypothetical protein
MTLVPVLFYPKLNEREHVLDAVARAEARHCETPLSIDPNRAGDLFESAGIKREDWIVHILEAHGVSLVNPDRNGIRSAYPNLADGYVDAEFRRMDENAEIWQRTGEDFETYAWSLDENQKAVVSCAALEEIIAGSLGEGIVALHFMADPDELRTALAEDNEITISPDPHTDGGVLFGLYNPANGSGSMEAATGPITIRPSLTGRMIVGTDEVLELFGTDAASQAKAKVEFVRGGPVMVSSRGDMQDDFGAPDVDLSALEEARAGYSL